MTSRQASNGHPEPTPRTGVAQVIIARDLLKVIHNYVNGFLAGSSVEAETGGMLVGEYLRNEQTPVFKLRGFIDAGPRAEFSPESVFFDGDYQFNMLQRLREREPRACNLGCIHLHPDQVDVCSENDWAADVQAVRMSSTKTLIFGILTLDNPRSDPLSLFYRNLKFDFFLLSQWSRFEYLHVRPTVEELPLMSWERQPPSSLAIPPAIRNRFGGGPCKLLKDKKRLVAEVRAMEERYGGQAVLRLKDNRLFWEYTVIESGRSFPIQVVYPRRYPFDPPRIFSLLPLPASPHQMPGNELCWINRLGQSDWNPALDTAATCIHAAHRWFACLLVYRTLGKWPAEADDRYGLCG